MEEACAGQSSGAEAALGRGSVPIPALAGSDPPSELPTAARHRESLGRFLGTPSSSEQSSTRDGEKGCLCPAAFGDHSALEEGLLKPDAKEDGPPNTSFWCPRPPQPVEASGRPDLMLLHDHSSLLPKALCYSSRCNCVL